MNETESLGDRQIILAESKADIIVGCVVLAFSLLLLAVIIPGQIADTGKAFPYPRSFPRFCGYSLLILSLCQLYQGYRKMKQNLSNSAEVVFPLKGVRVATLTMGILILSAVALNWLPYIPVTIVMLAALMWLFGQRNKVLVASVSIVMPTLIYYFFTSLLKLVLP